MEAEKLIALIIFASTASAEGEMARVHISFLILKKVCLVQASSLIKSGRLHSIVFNVSFLSALFNCY